MMKMVIMVIIIIIIIVIKAVAGEKQLASSDLALCHGKICNPPVQVVLGGVIYIYIYIYIYIVS